MEAEVCPRNPSGAKQYCRRSLGERIGSPSLAVAGGDEASGQLVSDGHLLGRLPGLAEGQVDEVVIEPVSGSGTGSDGVERPLTTVGRSVVAGAVAHVVGAVVVVGTEGSCWSNLSLVRFGPRRGRSRYRATSLPPPGPDRCLHRLPAGPAALTISIAIAAEAQRVRTASSASLLLSFSSSDVEIARCMLPERLGSVQRLGREATLRSANAVPVQV